MKQNQTYRISKKETLGEGCWGGDDLVCVSPPLACIVLIFHSNESSSEKCRRSYRQVEGHQSVLTCQCYSRNKVKQSLAFDKQSKFAFTFKGFSGVLTCLTNLGLNSQRSIITKRYFWLAKMRLFFLLCFFGLMQMSHCSLVPLTTEPALSSVFVTLKNGDGGKQLLMRKPTVSTIKKGH